MWLPGKLGNFEVSLSSDWKVPAGRQFWSLKGTVRARESADYLPLPGGGAARYAKRTPRNGTALYKDLIKHHLIPQVSFVWVSGGWTQTLSFWVRIHCCQEAARTSPFTTHWKPTENRDLHNFHNILLVHISNHKEESLFSILLIKTWTNTVDQDPFSNVFSKKQSKCLYTFTHCLSSLSVISQGNPSTPVPHSIALLTQQVHLRKESVSPVITGLPRKGGNAAAP